jgi:hypothetical protein
MGPGELRCLGRGQPVIVSTGPWRPLFGMSNRLRSMSRPRDKRERTVPTGHAQDRGRVLVGHAFEPNEQDDLALFIT